MRKHVHVVLTITAVVVLGNIQAQAVNLLSGGDFEPSGGEVPGWTLEQFATGSGTVLNTAEVVTWSEWVNSGSHSLWLRAFEGGEAVGPDNLTNAILSQIVPGVAGETYTFSGYAAFEANYSGSSDWLFGLAGGPLVGQPSPTQTSLELAFLDAGGSVIGAPMTVDIGPIQNIFSEYQQHTVAGLAPAQTASVRVTAAARDMVYNTDPGQSAFYDTFSLTGANNPGTEILANPDLEDPPPSPLDNWTITINDPENPTNDEIIRAAGFANHTPGGTSGIWLSSFLGESGTEVDGTLSQTVPGVDGGDYTFSGWSKFEDNYTAALTFMELAFLDGTDSVIGAPIMLDLSTVQVNDGTWREQALNGTAPTGTASVRVSAGMIDGVDAGANPQSAFFDDFSLELALNLPGDFDGDGDVDGDDFLVWQQGFGTIYDGNDFLIWQQNFGSGGGAGGAGGAVVPEPASAAMALLAACLIGMASRRRH